jgi:hypothetical protein
MQQVIAAAGGRGRERHRKEKAFSFSLHQNLHTSTQRYLQPPLVVPMFVSGHYAPQILPSYVIIWGAYDMCLFRGSGAWLQWGDVGRSYVLLVCRKFWFLWEPHV